MTRFFLLAAVIGSALAIGLVLRGALASFRPSETMDVATDGPPNLPAAAGDSLRLFSWNIGFAGLGKESDFFADGGRHLRAPTRSAVERNAAAITERLRGEGADVVMIQELAQDSWLTYGIDVKGAVQRALPGYQLAFAPAVRVTGLPLVGNLTVGNGTLARFATSRAVRHALPSKALPIGVTLQHFNALESRFPIEGRTGQWAVFNVHLAAFDDGVLRREQLETLLRLMRAEYTAGNHVVAGGDWNLRLVPTDFPYTTAEKAKFWVRDFPGELTPPGWTWAVDPATPTCRTLEQPYTPGVNYRCVIDGFLISPNVEVLGVETRDLGFVNSDHNPVSLKVRAR